MTGYIYIVENKINGKLYIGQTIQKLSRRWAMHCNANNGSNSALTSAIVKYGKRNFQMFVIEQINEDVKEILIDKLNILEKSYIQSYCSAVPSGYNIMLGGKNASKSESVRAKISASLMGNPKLKTNLGKKFTDEHKAKMSSSNRWSKSIECVETGKTYASIADAARRLGIQRTSLSVSLRKLGIYQGNLTLKYARK